MADVWLGRIAVVVGLVLAILVLPQAAFAEGGGGMLGTVTQDGARVSAYDRRELAQMKAEAAKAKAAKAAVQWEYASVANCGDNVPGSLNGSDFCQAAISACAGNTPEQGLGPSVRLFRRQVDAAGNPLGAWEQYGISCFPQDAPGAKPGLTMLMILAAFHDTAFARPSVEIQPKGNITLVTLPTYFAVTWPQAGFAPGEVDVVDPARMLGLRVEIRPLLKSLTYVYGDGSTSGPTTSLGGPYPTGDITKAYPKAGTFTVRADVTYGGQFQVGGGGWIDIPGEVTITGQPEDLQVKTAHARLVTN